MTTFIDTNILIKALSPEAEHHEWSVEQLASRKALGPAVIPDVVYCEFTIGMPDQESVDAAVAELALERFLTPDAALFRAGRAFMKYKAVNKGTKTGVLPDFIIGAIAETMGVPLLTTNPSDFRGYFDNLEIICP